MNAGELDKGYALDILEPRSGENNVSHGRKPVELDRSLTQPRRGDTGRRGFVPPLFLRLRSIELALRGASAKWKFKTTGSRPWLELYRRSAAKQHNETKNLASGGI